MMGDHTGWFVVRSTMNEPRLADMSEAEFEVLIEGHIERIAIGDHELPADLFVDLRLERSAARAKRHRAGSEADTAGYPPGTGIVAGDAPGGHHDYTDH